MAFCWIQVLETPLEPQERKTRDSTGRAGLEAGACFCFRQSEALPAPPWVQVSPMFNQ